MGKASRLRKERAQNLHLVFCDMDFDRGSRPFGPGVREAPPEAWSLGRVGLVYAHWNGHRLRIICDEILEGPHVASTAVSTLLKAKGPVIGHGLLSSDLRCVAMVTDVPEVLLRRCVDTLALAHRVRGKSYPTGCGLSKLAEHNLRGLRPKPSYPQSASGRRLGLGVQTAYRGAHDPRDDARLVARLWETMMTMRALSWGAGEPSWTHYDGDTRPGTPAGAAALGEEHIAELLGQARQPESREWRSRLLAGGRVLLPTEINAVAALLAHYTKADLPEPTMLRQLAVKLEGTGEVPRGLADEDLFTVCQWLGAKTNLEVRKRLQSGRPFTKKLRVDLAFALWQSTHRDFMFASMEARRRSREDVNAYFTMERMKQVEYAIRPRLAEAVI